MHRGRGGSEEVVLLVFTRVQLDVLTDIDQYLFLNQAMHGGLSMVSKCYSKANHLSLSEAYDT